MSTLDQGFIIDKRGNKKSVLVPYKEWIKIIRDLEELEEIKAYDRAKSEPSDPILFSQAVKELKEG